MLGCASLAAIADAEPAPDAVLAITAQRQLGNGGGRSGCRSLSARSIPAGARLRRSDRGCQAAPRSANTRIGAHTRTRTHTRPSRSVRQRQGATAPRAIDPTPLSSASAVAGENRATTIAAALATTCQNTELVPASGNLDLIRAAVLCLINQKRAQNGEAPLALNNELAEAAEGHSQELISADYFAHVSPSGLTPVDRIRETGYIPGPEVGYVIGENLAWGTYELATPQAIVSAWIASPGHLANILESQYVETGIGVTPQVPASLANGAPGATYAQEFGVILR